MGAEAADLWVYGCIGKVCCLAEIWQREGEWVEEDGREPNADLFLTRH